MTTELSTMYDSRQSFYGKARVEHEGNEWRLISYNTRVATIKEVAFEQYELEVYGTYSQTTLRHIKEFAKQYGFKAETSKQILADYGVEA